MFIGVGSDNVSKTTRSLLWKSTDLPTSTMARNGLMTALCMVRDSPGPRIGQVLALYKHRDKRCALTKVVFKWGRQRSLARVSAYVGSRR